MSRARSLSVALIFASALGCARGYVDAPADDATRAEETDLASDDVPSDATSDDADATSDDVPSDATSDADATSDDADATSDADADIPAADATSDADADIPAADATSDAAADVSLDRAVDGPPDAPPTPWAGSATARSCTTPGVIGARFDYLCAPGGAVGPVRGTGLYTHDSIICAAAVHAGRITAAAGGVVTIEMRPGQAVYTASTRNGITSSAFGAWPCSYVIVAPACVAPAAAACEGLCVDLRSDAAHCGSCGNSCGTGACTAGTCGCGAGLSACAGACVDLRSSAAHCGACGRACAAGETCVGGVCGGVTTPWSTNALDRNCATPGVVGMRFTYRCAPGGPVGTIWGTDVYTHDSSICTAAVHAGRITVASGGVVTIQMAPGQSSYPSTTRNGVSSSTWGTWWCSFTFP